MNPYLKKLSTKSSQLAQIPLYFFDEEQPGPVDPMFWTKHQNIHDPKKVTPSFGCYLYKKSKKKFGELKSVYVCIHKNYLIAAKSKEWYSKPYRWVDISKHFLVFQKMVGLPGKYSCGISLSYNQKQVEFYSKSMDDINGFLYQLKKNVIQINFEEMYILEQKLGAGSYADVYLVKDKLTRREYAAKFFDISAFRDFEKSRIALMNEIRIHRQLEHGNICRLHEAYETPSHIILVMEYAKGERLIDYVVSNSPLKEKECMKIMKELLETIIYLHSLKIIHRDIKLENILIDRADGQTERLNIRLIDFGLSVTTDNIDFFKRSGTPGYVAPEVLIADTYDTQIDIFSLGVILFTMLSGRSPFVGADRAAVLKLNRNCEYTFKPKYWDTKTQNSKDLVKKMMEAEPTKRLTAKEALEHKWFLPVTNNGVQSLKTLTRDSHRSVSPADGDPKSADRQIAKSSTLNHHNERTNNHKATRASLYNPKRPESVKNTDSPRFKNKSSLQTKKSNLLEIPRQNRGPFDGEEEHIDIEASYDGMNGGSIRTFYKLNSDAHSINSDPHDPRSIGEHSPDTRAEIESKPYDPQEIPGENANLKGKVSKLRKMDKSLKSPFRLGSMKSAHSRENSVSYYVETTSPEDGGRKESCNMTLGDSEEAIVTLPKNLTMFKASMGYVKQTSRIAEH